MKKVLVFFLVLSMIIAPLIPTTAFAGPGDHTVTYNGNGNDSGTVPVDTHTYHYDHTVSVLGNTGVLGKTGYTFSGWTSTAFSGVKNAGDTFKMPYSNVTLNASWTINNYTVTFNTDGGTPVDSITAPYNSSMTAPAAPTKDGYTFAGWSPEFPARMPLNGASLTALWTVNQYTVTFDSNGGTPVDSITADYGSSLTAPASPTKDGYTFAGWSPEFPPTMPLNGASLTAQWTINQYSITFDSNGGTAVDNITADYGAALTAPASPTKDGYTFAGWSPDFPATMPSGGASLTAQWTINQYSITFDSNGGTAVDSITADYGAALTAPASPTKDGYTFAGWSPEFPAAMPLNGASLTAQWTAAVVAHYSVTYNGNGATGGSVPVDTASYASGDTTTVPGNAGNLVKTSYTFFGWNTAANGTGTFYAPGASLTVSSSNVTLYAVWQKVSSYLADPGISGGTIAKAFVKTKYSYKVAMTENQSSITFTPVPDNSNASVWVNGVLITSVKPSRTFSIDYNHTKTVSIKVRYGGHTHVYKFTVRRAKSTYNLLNSLTAYANGVVVPFTAAGDPGTAVTFDPSINTWYVRVNEDTSKVTIKASGDGAKHETVSPRSATYRVRYGQDKIIKIKARSQSGKTNVYTVHIIRAKCSNADLKSLKLSIAKSYLVPAFSKDTLNYTITLPASRKSVKLYIRTAGYKAASVISNTSTGVSTKRSYMTVALPQGGSAKVKITVTAQDGTVKTYEVNIARNSS